MTNKSFENAKEQSKLLANDLINNPKKYRVLTGDRPTGNLHLGHYFGSIINRIKLQNAGIETYVLIADYQVLTDRSVFAEISKFTYELTLDYLACGLDPENYKTYIFPHSHIPELNQLTIPFLTLVSSSELNKNPTVKEEITASSMNSINAGMYTYPVHQAADILFCKSNIVPVGKDQLPHIELTRKIAKRFNTKFNKNVFPEPVAFFTSTPNILGLDGTQKMSKSRNNSILIKSTSDETVKLIKSAKTDSNRYVTYDPENRPEVSNLLMLASLCSDKNPTDIANEIGDQGSGKLKQVTAEAINTYFEPIRKKRKELEQNKDFVKDALLKGISKARETAIETLSEVTEAMNMKIQ
ncbi:MULTISPECIES: tryptophan--tRNA ligase [Flavobacteriaceae]|uniref:Tryptophan--tRNA ligase n=2 Tax=Flavobacteriaceae TaxID=49546 RepID=A0A4Y8ANJ4_9FLAO|nr:MULTISPECIES: tryptophan--tRNA ligase [Flavobacteriaceae]TEW72063.1 tryptophan--tRNA ligase [Gramella jeungdoensis]GGK56132.1 tryptophan--tRNA ligase [Lutibacter litoralis]